MAAPGAIPLSIKPATSGIAVEIARNADQGRSQDGEETAVACDGSDQVVGDVGNHQALQNKGKGQPFPEKERGLASVRPEGVTAGGLNPIAPYNVLRIADLRSCAATITDAIAQRRADQDAHALHDKDTETAEQPNTNCSDRLGDGEL